MSVSIKIKKRLRRWGHNHPSWLLGASVIIYGNIQAYPEEGVYQLVSQVIVDSAEFKFDTLKATFIQEGLLDPDRKKPLPNRMERIGVITAFNGVMLGDMEAVLGNFNRRVPSLIPFLSKMQGDDAVDDIIDQLGLAFKAQLDFLIIGRGGGSKDDLSVFNEEKLVRALANFPVYTIAAIGHARDESLCDLVVDQSVATPSEAARFLLDLAKNDPIIANNARWHPALGIQLLASGNLFVFSLLKKLTGLYRFLFV